MDILTARKCKILLEKLEEFSYYISKYPTSEHGLLFNSFLIIDFR